MFGPGCCEGSAGRADVALEVEPLPDAWMDLDRQVQGAREGGRGLQGSGVGRGQDAEKALAVKWRLNSLWP